MTYLNTAAEGIPPLVVGEAYAAYFRDRQRGSAGRERHMEQWREARRLAGGFLGLTTEEVGLCSCSSEAYNLAALALRLRPGEEVVVNDLDFPAGRTPWLLPECPAEVKVWRSREGALRLEDLVPLLSPRTRLVAASLVSFLNGFMLPVRPLVDTVRRHSSALLALDVTQAIGRVPLRLEGVDLMVSSTHKWILATHGGGIVGVPSARAAERTAPAGGWFNQVDPFGDDAGAPARIKAGAESFMVGMPGFPAIYALRAALEYLAGIGVEAIDRQTRPLVHACLRGLRQLPVQVITPAEDEHLAGIVAFRCADMPGVFARLAEQGIHVMQSAGRIRVSLHGYNRPEDVDRLLEGLRLSLK